jgi:hypothetical protein
MGKAVDVNELVTGEVLRSDEVLDFIERLSDVVDDIVGKRRNPDALEEEVKNVVKLRLKADCGYRVNEDPEVLFEQHHDLYVRGKPAKTVFRIERATDSVVCRIGGHDVELIDVPTVRAVIELPGVRLRLILDYTIAVDFDWVVKRVSEIRQAVQSQLKGG